VAPARALGWCMPEAMASGLPIACSRLTATSEILDYAGLGFDPKDQRGMANAMPELGECPELRASKAWAAAEQAHECSCKRRMDEMFRFFAEVTDDHGRGSRVLS
jgi:glycosyltransferase involved in cell wall biosynthesis